MRTARFIAKTRAFAYGLRDGWEQPYDVGSSQNLDHLYETYPGAAEDDLLDVQDKGINVGQFLRAGRKAESFENRYWPFVRKATTPTTHLQQTAFGSACGLFYGEDEWKSGDLMTEDESEVTCRNCL